MRTESTRSISEAALSVLVVLQLVMLAALFTRTPPHPPLAVTPFGMGPFLAASIAAAVAALVLGAVRTGFGTGAALTAGLLALLVFGPQKWIDPAFPEIWPAVILGQLAIGVLVWSCLRRCFFAPDRRATPAPRSRA